MVETAICEVQVPDSQAIGPTPTRCRTQLAKPASSGWKMNWKTSVAAATEVAYGASSATRKKPPAAQLVVEQVGQAEGDQQLRHGREQSDGEGVAQRLPEHLVVEQHV